MNYIHRFDEEKFKMLVKADEYEIKGEITFL
jgi:hypothetical protein